MTSANKQALKREDREFGNIFFNSYTLIHFHFSQSFQNLQKQKQNQYQYVQAKQLAWSVTKMG